MVFDRYARRRRDNIIANIKQYLRVEYCANNIARNKFYTTTPPSVRAGRGVNDNAIAAAVCRRSLCVHCIVKMCFRPMVTAII